MKIDYKAKAVYVSDDDVFEGDLNEIEKVIRNFLTNAIKHTIDNGFIYIKFKDQCFSIENEGLIMQNSEGIGYFSNNFTKEFIQ